MEVQPDEEIYLNQVRGMFIGDPSFTYVFNRNQEHIDDELRQVQEEEKRIELEMLQKKHEEETKRAKKEQERRDQEEQAEEETSGNDAGEEGSDRSEEQQDEVQGDAENIDSSEADDSEDDVEEAEKQYKPPKREVARHVSLREDIRLSHLINQIDIDGSVVPRGAYAINATEEVMVNETFSGLSSKDAICLFRYVHLRTPVRMPLKSLLEKDHLSIMLDFADSIDEDDPGQCWSLQYDDVFNSVVGRSLLWPGYVFFHVPNTRTYGSFYMGTGEKNMDLCFMIPEGSQ